MGTFKEKTPVDQGFSGVGRPGIEPVTPCVSMKSGAFSAPLDSCVFLGQRWFSGAAV
jgi:hypothetical protein